MKPKLIAAVSLFLAVILIIAICKNNTRTRKYLEYGQEFNEAIEDFDNKRQDFTDELKAVTVETTEDLSGNNKPVPAIAERWDEKWSNLTHKLERLKKDFDDVGKTSGKYFMQLEELVAGVGDDNLRSVETKRNKEVHDQWTKAYQDAARSIQKIEDVMHDGDDFYRVLVASSLRQQVRKDIEELEAITVRALDLLDELKEFSEEGKKLINNYS